MISNEHIGHPVRYWKNGQRLGKLLSIDGKTAEIQHPVLKRIQKVHVNDCEVCEGVIRMPTVFESLFKAAQTVSFYEQRPDQTDDEYLTFLIRAIATTSTEAWAALPDAAQQWYDKGAVNINTGKLPRDDNPLQGFNGKQEVAEIKQTVVPPKGLTATELLTQSQSRASRYQSSTPNPTQAPKERGKKGKGYMDAIRRTVILHPEWNSRQIYDYLRLNGFPDAKLDTISVDGGNIRRVIEIAKEFGFWITPAKAPTQQESVASSS